MWGVSITQIHTQKNQDFLSYMYFLQLKSILVNACISASVDTDDDATRFTVSTAL